MQFLKFPVFYKKYGVRYVENATSPLPKVLVDMPENSAVHVYDEGSALFPSEGIPFIDNSKKKIPLINITELMDKSHTQSRVNNPINQKLSEFIRSNKKFIKSNASLADIKDEKTVVVFNYNPIKSFYKYAEGIVMNTFWKWFDVYDTLWNNVNEQTKISPRNHYLFMDVPTQLPAKSRLEASKEANNQGMLKFFNAHEDFFLLDLWRWVHPETRSLSSLGRIGTEHLSKINLMLKLKDGRYVALNLGYINSWIVGQPNQTDKKTITQRKPGLIATLILVFMIRLQSVTEDENPSISDHLESGDIDDLEEGTSASFQTSPEEDSEPESLDDDLSSGIGKPGKEKISKKSSKSSIKEQLKKIDKNQKASEDTRTIEDILQDAEAELAALEDISRRREAIGGPIEAEEEYDPEGGVSREEVEKDVFGIRTPKERLIEQLDQVVSNGLMNAADYRKILKNIEKQETMLNPYGGNETIQEFIKVKPEDLEIKKEDIELTADGRVLDSSMKSSVVEAFDKTYITKVMRKDIMAAIVGIQNSGVVITDIDTSISRSITGSFEVHSVTVKPLRGESSTLRVRVPVVDPDGTYVANAVRYHLRKQRTDLPCRKTDPSRVGLSSHTGKLSISRPSKQAQKELTSVFKKIDRGSIGEEANIYKVIAANVLDKEFEGPYIFNALSESYKGFTVKHEIFGDLNFDFSRKEYVGSKDRVTCGTTAKGHQIVVNNDDTFDIITPNDTQKLGNIHEILDIDRTKVPVDAAILKVVGQQIPIGLVLCRSVGLRGVIKLLNCKYRVEDSKKRKALEPDEYAVTFKNKRYVFSRNDKQASLILGGLTHFEKQLKNYDAEVFDNKEIYNHLLEIMGCGVSVGRELDHLETSYVDPVTQRLLIKMNEPATFLGLLTRSASLLTNYSSPMPQDMDVQQIRGYDRIAGAIHKQLYKAVRTFKNKNLSTRTKIEMGHFAVWSAIREDPAKKTCEDINPIQNLKMHESVTFVGEGGRSKEAFMKEDRAFNVKDAGVISGDSVDSGDVGINIFMSANPRISDVTGTKSKSDEPLGAGNYLSPSILLAAGAQYDDAKRNGFVSIQNSHTIPCVGYHQPYVQTGYESLMIQRVDKIFGLSAKQDGVVTHLTDKAIRIKYEDGTEDNCLVGRQYGSAEGSTYPHDIVPMLKEGDKFVKGDTICYHDGFFEVDFLNPKRVVMKFGMVVETVFMEDPRTHEDSCSISKDLAQKLRTKTTKVKSYVVNFEQALHNAVKPGTQLEPEDVLMVIENAISVGVGNFDAESMATLRGAGTPAPRSSYTGHLDRIEVYYHGDKIDMHPSLKALADRSDRFFSEQQKDLGNDRLDGRVDGDFSVKGKPLMLNQAEVRFYITVEHDMSPGDKGVFANQLKTTVGEEMKFDMISEGGIKIDAMFGGRSAIKRIVNSYALIGTATGNLQKAQEHMVRMWEGS